MVAAAVPTDRKIQAEFLKLLPQLCWRLHHRFLGCGPDLHEERVAEGVALGWSFFRSARKKNKDITVGNLAWYVVKTIRDGRRLTGSCTIDVMSESPRTRERVGLVFSLADRGPGGDEDPLYEIVADRHWRWPVVEYVGTHLDWNAFVKGCSGPDRVILAMRLEGHLQNEIATFLGITPPAVNQRLRALRASWDAQAVA